MKFFSVTLALFIPLFSLAAIFTVDNSSSSPGQYTSFTAAYNVASAGDTIYVRGSLHTYGSISIKKKIILIGSGYNPSPANTYPTLFDDIDIIRSGGTTNGSGTEIYGVKVKSSGDINISGSSYSGYLSNVRIERCEAYVKSYRSNGLKLINNILKVFIGSGTGGNSVVYNNIIKSVDFYNTYYANSLTFDHSVFTDAAASAFRHCIVKNSIFYGTTPGNSVSSTAFSNNMSYASANDTFDITTNSSSGFNNQSHTNPNFVSVSSTLYNYFNDYHLQSGSPAINASSDGTNMGIYGGLYPFPIGGASGSGFQTSQEPVAPQIYEYTIQNNIIQPSDTLHINVKVSIQK